MKRISLILLTILMLGGTFASAQDMFVSSDGAIIMTVPPGWSIMETAPGSLFAIADDGTQVAITYGAAIDDQLDDVMRAVLDSEEAIPDDDAAVLAAFSLAEAAGIEPVITGETLRGREVLRYIDLNDDGAYDAYYVTNTSFTGTIQFAVYGASEPVLPMLALLDAIEPPAPVTFDCASVTLDRDSAAPGAVMQVENVPVGLDDFYVQVSAPDVAEAAPVPVVATDEEAVMLSPLYPDMRLEGGAVMLQLVHNGTICQEIGFDVQAIPEAPGELERFINAAQELVDASVAYLDVSHDDLFLTPVPEALIPLAEAQFLISHPENPGSLDTLAEFAEPDELRLLEALLAHDGYVASLQARAALVRSHTPTAHQGGVQLISTYANEPIPQRVTPFNAARGVTINTAQDLSYYMRYQAAFDQLHQDISDTVDTITLANSSVGVATAFGSRLGAIGTTAASRAGIVGAAVSVAGLTGGTLIDLYRHMLPSEFTMVYTTVEMPRIRNEDDGETYQVRDMLVSVRSQEWRLTKTIADTVITGLGAAGAVRSAVNASSEVAEATGRLSTYLDNGSDAVTGVDYVSTVCGVMAPDCDSDRVSVGPYTWNNISLQVGENDGLFVDFDVLDDLTGPEPSIRITPRISYEAIDNGLTVVRARPRPEAFGDRTMPERLYITVDPISIRTTAPRYADPGDVVCAESIVRNAHDDTLEWRVVDMNGNILLQERAEGLSPHEICFEIPEITDPAFTTNDLRRCLRTERDAYIFVAESQTRTGARAFNFDTKPRRGTASVIATTEEDICEGLWEVRALEEAGDMCSISPPLPTGATSDLTPQRILQDLIVSGALDSLLSIEVLDRGQSILVTDMIGGDEQIMTRVNAPTTTRDIGVEIVLEDGPDVDGIATELVPQGDGEYKVVRAPVDSTVWVDGYEYRTQYNIPVPNGRQIEPMVISFMFINPEVALANLTWHIQMDVPIMQTTHTANCEVDILYRAELIQAD